MAAVEKTEKPLHYYYSNYHAVHLPVTLKVVQGEMTVDLHEPSGTFYLLT